MVTLDDWSELVTVNYMGGYCGDFFSILLKKAIVGQANYYLDKNNRYYFQNHDVFNQDLKSLVLIRIFEENKREKDYEVQKRTIKHYIPGYHDEYYKMYKVYFSDGEDIARDIREYLYHHHSKNFDGSLKVANFHNQNNNLFSLQEIFPKSKNIVLLCPEWFFGVTRSLYSIKSLKDNPLRQNYLATNVNQFNKLEYYNGFFDSKSYFPTNCNNEFEIDIFELFFNDANYDKQLSDYLQTDIKLDKDDIQIYKKKNIELLKQFDIDPYQKNDKQYFVDRAIKYFNDSDFTNMKVVSEDKLG